MIIGKFIKVFKVSLDAGLMGCASLLLLGVIFDATPLQKTYRKRKEEVNTTANTEAERLFVLNSLMCESQTGVEY